MEKELKELGLSEYEGKVYLALVSNGTLTGNKTSKISGVPQGKVYDTIYKLSQKGFVSIMNSKPKLFKAIDPEIALKQLINGKKIYLEDLELTLPKKIKKLSILRREETDEKVSVFTGRKNAFMPNHHIMETSKKSLDMMFTFEIILPKTKRLLLEKKKNGVNIRIIATKKVNMNLINEIISYGLKVRYYPVDEIRIFTRDKEEANIQIVNPKDFYDRTNILVQSEELSKALTEYFESVWKKAQILN